MRLAVVGLGQGRHLARWAATIGLDVVVLCDSNEERLVSAAEDHPGARLSRRWEDLLECEINAVILANDFDAHAPLATAFLNAGIHVLSESAACTSEAEGRTLIKAAASAEATYSLFENYVAHPHVRSLAGILATNRIGPVQLIEADYLHSMHPADVDHLIGNSTTWRGRISPAAYCTHTLSPILHLTNAWPQEVTAFPVHSSDSRRAVVMTVRLSTGALAITRHGFLSGEPDSHWSWVSIRGSKGLAESLRAPGEESWSVRLREEGWAHGSNESREHIRRADPVELAGSRVDRRDEGTVLMLQRFHATVKHGTPPIVPVRVAVAASLVGVAGAESLVRGSIPIQVPEVSQW